MKRFHWFEIALIVAIMGTQIYAALSAPHNFTSTWFVRDDAYYYFKVAQNISEGRGSTFDGINLTNGYHPLWMLVCIPIFALARFDLILPLRVLLVVLGVLSTITSILFFRLLKKAIAEPLAVVAVAFWSFSPDVFGIVTQPGMETGIVVLSIVLLLFLMQQLDQKWRTSEITKNDIFRLTLASLFVLFSRLDTIYIVLLAGVWIIFRKTPIRYFLPIDLLATFSIIVIAYIQRSDLQVYLRAYSDSAMLIAGVTFLIQTVTFYFVGLYRHPKSEKILASLLRTVLGVTVSAALSGAAMFTLSAFGLAIVPRAVPLLFWGWMLPVTILTRFAIRIVSPWSSSPSDGKNLIPKPIHTKLSFWQELKSSNLYLRENFKNWLTEGLIYYGIVGTALGTYIVFNQWMFGTLMPVSGQIKRWWGTFSGNVYSGNAKTILDLFGIDPLFSTSWSFSIENIKQWTHELVSNFPTVFPRNDDAFYLFALGIIVIIIILPMLINRKRSLAKVFSLGLIPLFFSAELHAFIFSATPFAAKQEWYWSMQMLTIVIVSILSLDTFLSLFPFKKAVHILTWFATAIISLNMAWAFAVDIYTSMPYQDSMAGQPFMDQLPILEGYTEPGAIIGMTGGGNAGYFIKDRTIVNMDGLINSYDYFQAMQAGQGGKFLANKGLDYVFANWYIMTSTAPYSQQFDPEELIPVDNAPIYGRKQLLRYIPKP